MIAKMSIKERIESLGHTLPIAPTPVANYIPAIKSGNEVMTSGQVPFSNGAIQYMGSIPSQQSIESGVKAAELCALNAIAAAVTVLDGNADRIIGVKSLKVYVASDIGFTAHPKVANGASDLMVEIFGDSGKHIRVAMGSIGLPLESTVELEAVFTIDE
tara:strand:- start:1670 stop:2146 length:477 start_codon:yes stop_codon:yes gene_type:complete